MDIGTIGMILRSVAITLSSVSLTIILFTMYLNIRNYYKIHKKKEKLKIYYKKKYFEYITNGGL